MALKQTLRMMGSAAAAGVLLFSSATTASADQTRKDQWPLEAFGVSKVWQIATGKGITVAVIDTGVDASHPDLRGNVLKGHDFVDGDDDPSPAGDEHGTSMAGIIAGHGHGANGADGVKGLAPDAKILSIRDTGEGDEPFAKSIRYAVDHGASIINISQITSPSSQAGEEAVAYAFKKNVVVVAGTGNDGTGGDRPLYPASYPGAVAVGAVKSSGEIWAKSNYGPKTLLTAPGVGIVSTGGATANSQYNIGEGTSASTAYVSAACALLREKFPDLTAGQIVNRLTKTAGLPDDAKGSKLPDQKYGYGYIQPLAALKQDIPAGPKNGPLTMPTSDSASSGTGTGTGKTDSSPAPSSSGKSDDSGSSSTIIGVVVGALVVLLVAGGIVLLVARKKRRGGPANPPPGYGTYAPQPNQLPQAYGTPIYNQNPHQQQPAPPAGPPNQPPPGGGNPYQQ
ncbi:type VII secretion-associated serine protease mycosin [Streptomyces sp. NBC_01465]|uniref:type VII secretion-associated serine protease mycosin n=1 Tax=Streptomyces sp. NBC_01465 TaxID=2903878 RepID=UPI002E340BC9|nr:type VII secretion-associated serine protease mycosin [Streptomyces sp. NBC_01465]